ncbi:MAG: helix-turn-helix transcriptional regulator [Bifidobacterium tsurumiense]|uniref:helix-turn-helix domain-containing protein n=1 Tax=Bifidobacterium tsurumiense TaxID=356829 RepID=UPI002A841E00|nr:helix-turn-helix transcriptional regulator [Bifidobacterium tsurumiense]MDY4677570.1 helix-turn-helix transcriptional regulator [Bifidobacterium tsurumiense]
MTPIEFKTRRIRAGLSQEEMGRVFAFLVPTKNLASRLTVAQSAVSRWEGSRGLPAWADAEALDVFKRIDDISQSMIDAIIAQAQLDLEDAAGTQGEGGKAVVRVFDDDEAFWQAQPRFTDFPHILWNIAAVNAADMMPYMSLTLSVDGE